MFSTADTFRFEFSTYNTSGSLTAADDTPTGTLVVNGADSGAAVTISSPSTGRYKGSVALSGHSAGDVFYVRVSATVGGVTQQWTTPTHRVTATVGGYAAGQSPGELVEVPDSPDVPTAEETAAAVTAALAEPALVLYANKTPPAASQVDFAGLGFTDIVELPSNATDPEDWPAYAQQAVAAGVPLMSNYSEGDDSTWAVHLAALKAAEPTVVAGVYDSLRRNPDAAEYHYFLGLHGTRAAMVAAGGMAAAELAAFDQWRADLIDYSKTDTAAAHGMYFVSAYLPYKLGQNDPFNGPDACYWLGYEHARQRANVADGTPVVVMLWLRYSESQDDVVTAEDAAAFARGVRDGGAYALMLWWRDPQDTDDWGAAEDAVLTAVAGAASGGLLDGIGSGGSGNGPYVVTVSTGVAGASVSMTNQAGVVFTATADEHGVARFGLAAGTYTPAAFATGYDSAVGDDVSVTGAESLTLTLTENVVSPPGDPLLTTVVGQLRKGDGTPDVNGRLLVKLTTVPEAAEGVWFRGQPFALEADGSGAIEAELPRGGTFTIDGTAATFTIPADAEIYTLPALRVP